jgi:hypothetical protein
MNNMNGNEKESLNGKNGIERQWSTYPKSWHKPGIDIGKSSRNTQEIEGSF